MALGDMIRGDYCGAELMVLKVFSTGLCHAKKFSHNHL